MTKAIRVSARGSRATEIARGKPVRAKSKTEPQSNAHPNSLTKPLPRPHGNRLVFAPELIADGKRRYETTPESLDSIAIDFSSNRSTLKNIAKRENWVRYVPPPRGLPPAAAIAAKAEALEAAALEAEALSSPPAEWARSPRETRRVGVSPAQQETPFLTASPSGGGNGDWSMRARIDALRGAVDEELAAVRALRASLKGVPRSTEAASRTSRTLADLTTTLERLHRLEIGALQHNGQDAYADRTSDMHADMPADLDAYRLDLARRIDAFIASRTDGGTAGEPAAAPAEGD